MYCQSCGARNSEDEEYCLRCHQKLLVVSGPLTVVEEEGLEARWARHRRHHRVLTAGLGAMGLEAKPLLISADSLLAPAVPAFEQLSEVWLEVEVDGDGPERFHQWRFRVARARDQSDRTGTFGLDERQRDHARRRAEQPKEILRQDA